MPKISLIIPVYNAENYIPICVKSIEEQTFRDFEVIFINDGSADHSLSMLQALTFKDIEVTILSDVNQGQAMARNRGIEQSSGEFICFLDIDDFIEAKMLEELYDQQQKSNADIVWCNAYKVIDGVKVGTLDDGMQMSGDTARQYMLHNAGPWRKLIRTSMLKEHQLYFPPIRFYEDVAIIPAYALHASKIDYINIPLYDYVMHAGSTMHQRTYDKRLEDIFASMDYLRQQFQADHSDHYQDCIEYLHIDHLLHAASLRFFSFPEGREALCKINEVIRTAYPKWRHNIYFKEKNWKYRLVCHLFYQRQYWLLKRMIK